MINLLAKPNTCENGLYSRFKRVSARHLEGVVHLVVLLHSFFKLIASRLRKQLRQILKLLFHIQKIFKPLGMELLGDVNVIGTVLNKAQEAIHDVGYYY